jgi:hypothetical protein
MDAAAYEGIPMDEKDLPALAALFLETWKAHHQAYMATEGFDPEWPIWYAEYLKPRLAEWFGEPLTASEIVHLLVAVEKERLGSGTKEDWTQVYARFFLKHGK